MRSKLVDIHAISEIVRHFSHGLGINFDGITTSGCHRETLETLGFGWLYFALAEIIQPKSILVIGSGRGYSLACLSIGARHVTGFTTIFVDPGYSAWSVDKHSVDTADGLWENESSTRRCFAEKLGDPSVTHLKLTSDEAFARLSQEQKRFDIVFIDGEHSYRQCLADLHNAWQLLQPGGVILAHDTYCKQWPGVAMALNDFCRATNAGALTIPLEPGITVLQKHTSLFSIRHSTFQENILINEWRNQAGVTPRPLQGEPFPARDGDPRVGLFTILEDGEVIGGFGIKNCVFTKNGPDDFLPHGKSSLRGFLRYGGVIREDRRLRGIWQWVTAETLGCFPEEGFYDITTRDLESRATPWKSKLVGTAGAYRAYHVHLQKANSSQRGAAGLATFELLASARPGASVFSEILELQNDRINALLNSTSWKLTAPLRWFSRATRQLARRVCE